MDGRLDSRGVPRGGLHLSTSGLSEVSNTANTMNNNGLNSSSMGMAHTPEFNGPRSETPRRVIRSHRGFELHNPNSNSTSSLGGGASALPVQSNLNIKSPSSSMASHGIHPSSGLIKLNDDLVLDHNHLDHLLVHSESPNKYNTSLNHRQYSFHNSPVSTKTNANNGMLNLIGGGDREFLEADSPKSNSIRLRSVSGNNGSSSHNNHRSGVGSATRRYWDDRPSVKPLNSYSAVVEEKLLEGGTSSGGEKEEKGIGRRGLPRGGRSGPYAPPPGSRKGGGGGSSGYLSPSKRVGGGERRLNATNSVQRGAFDRDKRLQQKDSDGDDESVLSEEEDVGAGRRGRLDSVLSSILGEDSVGSVFSELSDWDEDDEAEHRRRRRREGRRGSEDSSERQLESLLSTSAMEDSSSPDLADPGSPLVPLRSRRSLLRRPGPPTTIVPVRREGSSRPGGGGQNMSRQSSSNTCPHSNGGRRPSNGSTHTNAAMPLKSGHSTNSGTFSEQGDPHHHSSHHHHHQHQHSLGRHSSFPRPLGSAGATVHPGKAPKNDRDGGQGGGGQSLDVGSLGTPMLEVPTPPLAHHSKSSAGNLSATRRPPPSRTTPRECRNSLGGPTEGSSLLPPISKSPSKSPAKSNNNNNNNSSCSFSTTAAEQGKHKNGQRSVDENNSTTSLTTSLTASQGKQSSSTSNPNPSGHAAATPSSGHHGGSRRTSASSGSQTSSGGAVWRVKTAEKEDRVGRGSFGNVYRGKDTATGRTIAIKEIILVKDFTKDYEGLLTNLEREVRVMRQLQHSNMIRYLGVNREDNALQIFMEFLTGGTIRDRLRAKGFFSDPLARFYTAQLLCGLDYLHHRQIVHRDLKGDNLFLTGTLSEKSSLFTEYQNLLQLDPEMGPYSVVKVGDFGTSKELTNTLTTNTITGTPNFMAPEVVNSKGHSFQADIWSVGCCVVEMLTGLPPFAKMDNHMAILFAVMRGQFMEKLPKPGEYGDGTTALTPAPPPVEGETSERKPAPPPPHEPITDQARDFISKCTALVPSERWSVQQLMEHPWILASGFNAEKEKAVAAACVGSEPPSPSGAGGGDREPPQHQGSRDGDGRSPSAGGGGGGGPSERRSGVSASRKNSNNNTSSAGKKSGKQQTPPSKEEIRSRGAEPKELKRAFPSPPAPSNRILDPSSTVNPLHDDVLTGEDAELHSSAMRSSSLPLSTAAAPSCAQELCATTTADISNMRMRKKSPLRPTSSRANEGRGGPAGLKTTDDETTLQDLAVEESGIRTPHTPHGLTARREPSASPPRSSQREKGSVQVSGTPTHLFLSPPRPLLGRQSGGGALYSSTSLTPSERSSAAGASPKETNQQRKPRRRMPHRKRNPKSSSKPLESENDIRNHRRTTSHRRGESMDEATTATLAAKRLFHEDSERENLQLPQQQGVPPSQQGISDTHLSTESSDLGYDKEDCTTQDQTCIHMETEATPLKGDDLLPATTQESQTVPPPPLSPSYDGDPTRSCASPSPSSSLSERALLAANATSSSNRGRQSSWCSVPHDPTHFTNPAHLQQHAEAGATVEGSGEAESGAGSTPQPSNDRHSSAMTSSNASVADGDNRNENALVDSLALSHVRHGCVQHKSVSTTLHPSRSTVVEVPTSPLHPPVRSVQGSSDGEHLATLPGTDDPSPTNGPDRSASGSAQSSENTPGEGSRARHAVSASPPPLSAVGSSLVLGGSLNSGVVGPLSSFHSSVVIRQTSSTSATLHTAGGSRPGAVSDKSQQSAPPPHHHHAGGGSPAPPFGSFPQSSTHKNKQHRNAAACHRQSSQSSSHYASNPCHHHPLQLPPELVLPHGLHQNNSASAPNIFVQAGGLPSPCSTTSQSSGFTVQRHNAAPGLSATAPNFSSISAALGLPGVVDAISPIGSIPSNPTTPSSAQAAAFVLGLPPSSTNTTSPYGCNASFTGMPPAPTPGSHVVWNGCHEGGVMGGSRTSLSWQRSLTPLTESPNHAGPGGKGGWSEFFSVSGHTRETPFLGPSPAERTNAFTPVQPPLPSPAPSSPGELWGIPSMEGREGPPHATQPHSGRHSSVSFTRRRVQMGKETALPLNASYLRDTAPITHTSDATTASSATTTHHQEGSALQPPQQLQRNPLVLEEEAEAPELSQTYTNGSGAARATSTRHPPPRPRAAAGGLGSSGTAPREPPASCIHWEQRAAYAEHSSQQKDSHHSRVMRRQLSALPPGTDELLPGELASAIWVRLPVSGPDPKTPMRSGLSGSVVISTSNRQQQQQQQPQPLRTASPVVSKTLPLGTCFPEADDDGSTPLLRTSPTHRRRSSDSSHSGGGGGAGQKMRHRTGLVRNSSNTMPTQQNRTSNTSPANAPSAPLPNPCTANTPDGTTTSNRGGAPSCMEASLPQPARATGGSHIHPNRTSPQKVLLQHTKGKIYVCPKLSSEMKNTSSLPGRGKPTPPPPESMLPWGMEYPEARLSSHRQSQVVIQ